MSRSRWTTLAISTVLTLFAVGVRQGELRGDTVIMKTGSVYRGTVDQDNTICFIFDGIKRVVVRDSKIQKRQPDASFRSMETFKLEQPLVLHGGAMPKEVVRVQADPWNDKGRRMFQYIGSNLNRTTKMEQAINELGPHVSRVRGVDGFWQGQIPTSQIPREVVLGLLAKVERKNREERQRVYTFLIQAEWYTEAKNELDSIARDFPDLKENVANARTHVVQLEAAQLRHEIDVRRKAQQFKEVAARLKAFPSKDVGEGLLIEIGDQLRKDQTQAASDAALAAGLSKASDRLSKELRQTWKAPLKEVLDALNEAPDAVRDRFAAWEKANAEAGPTTEQRFALAMSGFLVGADAAVSDLDDAEALWNARDLIRKYLRETDDATRARLLDDLHAVHFLADPPKKDPSRELDLVTRIVQRMPPPLHEKIKKPKEPQVHTIAQPGDDLATEYTVLLPPEYHPLRSYPTVVALHSGDGPKAAIDWWGAEAARRGYILIVPEYQLPGQGKGYHFTPSEHATVELSLRDARRRYAIDSDQVFLGGQLSGGDMAWDYGLAHPDEFAGVIVISGEPAKYVPRYLSHTKLLPFYVALGDLAPASNEVIFASLVRPLIAKGWDVTYSEFVRRGREDFPEEVTPAFDWMEHHRRDPQPDRFDAWTARTCDDRFYGVVVREFAAGRTTAPAAADPTGRNLRPATIKMNSSKLVNLMRIETNGITRFDIWVSPLLIDFKRKDGKMEVRVNGRPQIKRIPKLEIEPYLEDLRIRGDRQQPYWLKIPVG